MSYTVSAAWSRHVSSPYCTEHGQRLSAVLSNRITTITMFRSGQLGRYCTIEPNYSGMSACFAGASVIHQRALKICEPSCVPGVVRHFFIPVIHSPLRAVGYVVASELSSRGGRARSHGTRGSVRAHFGREVRSGDEEHVAASELNSVSRQDPGPRDMWQHRSPLQQGGEVRGYMTCGSTGAHLDREERFEATWYMAGRGCMSCYLS
jgi:hypothetical protein